MNAVMVYDDSTIAATPNAMRDRAPRRADEALIWKVKPWKCEVLLQRPAADAACDDARVAHWIVLASRNQSALPARLINE